MVCAVLCCAVCCVLCAVCCVSALCVCCVCVCLCAVCVCAAVCWVSAACVLCCVLCVVCCVCAVCLLCVLRVFVVFFVARSSVCRALLSLFVFRFLFVALLYESPGGNQVDGLPPALNNEKCMLHIKFDIFFCFFSACIDRRDITI